MKLLKLPILEIGAPGIGKTAKIRSQFDHCEVLLMSSQAEEDIAGIPYQVNGYEKRTIPPFIQRLQQAHGEGKTTCLFLDELDKARREVADTLLTLITHQEEFGIPAETYLRAAANPVEWGGGDGISKPMLSRFCVVESKPDFLEWKDWVHSNYEFNELDAILKSIQNGECPFLETTGDGYQWRLTCPRTLAMAFDIMISGQDKEMEARLINGLLTPSAAFFLTNLNKKETKTNKASSVMKLRAAVQKGNAIQPLRIIE